MRLIRSFDIIGLFILTALLLSCSRFEMENPDKISRDPAVMRFSASYPLVQTRATEAGFVDGDRMGIFVVDYADGCPGVLNSKGNRADNVRFTYDESSMLWDGTVDIHWKDKNTPVDIYGYYPYDSELSSVEDYRFSVSTRQDVPPTDLEPGGYESSDLLWAKSENVRPTDDKITLTYGHLLAGVTVILQMGEGFDSAEWTSLEKTVLIKNTVTEASVDLATGSVVPVQAGGRKTIVPYLYDDEYRSVVVPQVLEADHELISITIDGISYSFSRQDLTVYTSGKMHKFTIKVDKHEFLGGYKFTLANETISDWREEYHFIEGVSRTYITVDIDVPGTLSTILESKGMDVKSIVNLKITGFLNHQDLYFCGHELSSLQCLNIKDIKIVGEKDEIDVLSGFGDHPNDGFHSNIQKIILPDSIKRIDDFAFYDSRLTGSLVIPEGVEEIGFLAFALCDFTGSLTLPSSLRIIEGGAFAYSGLRGEVILPEGLEVIGSPEKSDLYMCNDYGPFEGCSFTGTFLLPSTLVAYHGPGLEEMTGHINIPQGIQHIPRMAFMNSKCTTVTIPDGVISVGFRSFAYTSLQGELVLPSSCRFVYSEAFRESNISSAIFPDDLQYIGMYAFKGCNYLSGEIKIPKGVIDLPYEVFRDCHMLSEVVLHDEIVSIDEYAFAYCHNLQSFICLAEEPPYLADNAFEGVPRDNFTIEVPPGSVEKYKRASGWKEFKRIAEYSNFVCRPATACALSSAHRQTLVLNADGPWTVSHLPEWCSVTPSSGDGKTEVTLTIDALAHGSAHRADSVVFTLADGGHKTWCEVSQYDYEYDEDEVVTLQKATKGNGIDVVFLGDGWDGEAISNGSYMNLVREQMQHFFGIEPYTTYRDYFNVYAGIALSQETGVNTLNTYRDTRFMTIYGGGGCNNVEPHLSVEKDDVFDYVLQHSPLQRKDLPESIVILVPNSTDYGGCTYVYDDGSAISICCPSEAQYPSDTRGIIQHEAGGHGFGKLGDEMILRNLFADSGTKGMIDSYHSRGWYKNVATSGKMSDVPWAHFIFDPEYSDYVDIFEGAMGFTRGVWRSEQNSCMNYGIPYYNAISRQEIMRRILDYSGEGFTMEKFYATDSKKWGDSSVQTKAMPDQAYVQNAWHTAPYVE